MQRRRERARLVEPPAVKRQVRRHPPAETAGPADPRQMVLRPAMPERPRKRRATQAPGLLGPAQRERRPRRVIRQPAAGRATEAETRRQIQQQVATYEMLPDKVGYIKIVNFNTN